jgi:hypothetical protein
MRRRNILISLASLLFAPLAAVRAGLPATARDETEYDAARNRLAIAIRGYARMVGEQDDPKILRAIAIVPRHLFVPIKVRNEAYEDYPLSIGADQTISQPSLVALMTHLLRPRSDDTMLEIGTGSGYQAAILSHLVARSFRSRSSGRLRSKRPSGSGGSAIAMSRCGTGTAILAGPSTLRSTVSS